MIFELLLQATAVIHCFLQCRISVLNNWKEWDTTINPTFPGKRPLSARVQCALVMDPEESSRAGDVYYSCNDRDKYRSVHPPHASLQENSPERFQSSAEWPTPFNRHATTGKCPLDSKSLSSSMTREVDMQKIGQDGLVNGNIFKMANIDDCHSCHQQNFQDVSSSNVASVRQCHSSQSTSPLSVAPLILCNTHFFVNGRSWSSLELTISQSLQNLGRVTLEHLKSEHMWRCNSSTTSFPIKCSLQIRAYIDADGNRFVVEVQKISGDEYFFNHVYHSIMNDLYTSVTTAQDCQLMGADVSADKSYDTSFEFLLLPVLEMIQSDYPDMQSEALRMAIELSNPSESSSRQPQVEANYVSASVRKQMRDFGFIAVLVHLVCKNLSNGSALSSSDSGRGQISHQAVTVILNLGGMDEDRPNSLDLTRKEEEFLGFLGRISRLGLEGYSDSPRLQAACTELLHMPRHPSS